MLAKNKYPMNNKIEYNYNYNPKTSIIINYFTSVETMIKTIDNLRSLGDEVEIIINNDRCGENSEKIMKTLTHRNDRMVIANDLGEKRGYHHGAQISNASDFLIFTQDDDLAPLDNKWYLDCLKEFNDDPKLGMIGLLKGGIHYAESNAKTFTDQYEKRYVSWLATGPLMIRKDLYFSVKGWSEEYSQIGEMDGGADADLTTKVILAGYKSMLLRTSSIKIWKRRFQRGDGLTKNDLKNLTQRTLRLNLNNKIYVDKFKDDALNIHKLVDTFNLNI
jgi:GT2 family glycosyltransferase